MSHNQSVLAWLKHTNEVQRTVGRIRSLTVPDVPPGKKPLFRSRGIGMGASGRGGMVDGDGGGGDGDGGGGGGWE